MGPVKGSKKRSKRDFDETNAIINGSLSPSKGLDQLKSVVKVSSKTFSYICSLVREDMETNQFSFSGGRTLTLKDQVAIALRRLSTGDSLISVGEYFGLHHATVSQVAWHFVESMERRALHHLQWPSNDQQMKEIKSKFEKVKGFPNCCGAIDTTHVSLRLPLSHPDSKVWCDRENNHTMLLQAIVDPDMKFRDVVTGWPGKMSDSLVLHSSNFANLCEKGKRLNGKAVVLSEGSEIREYIVGDMGFPLLPWLITPFRGKDLKEAQADFNKRHFATRLVAKRALARLKDMWKIIRGTMWRPDKHKLPRTILVCCILHNIIIDLEDEVRDELPLCHTHDAGYRKQICDSVDMNASDMREKLSLYLAGRLPS